MMAEAGRIIFAICATGLVGALAFLTIKFFGS